MLTVCGQAVPYADALAHVQTIGVPTIAHSLACINRYTGHALRPISVAEHSLLVVEILERLFNPGPQSLCWLLMAGLLHDAHECITNDLASPAKPLVPGWHGFEGEWEHAFHTAFGLRCVYQAHARTIRRADLMALATERRDLMHPGGPPWAVLHGVPAVEWVDLRQREAFTWQDWRQAFIDKYDELAFACSTTHQQSATHEHC